MKRVIGISLLLLFISNIMFKAALIFNYWQNKEVIIAACCINKNKPELKCEGKCYISSQLNKVDSGAKDELPVRIIDKDFELFLTMIEDYKVGVLNLTSSKTETMKHMNGFDYHSSVFQPPTV